MAEARRVDFGALRDQVKGMAPVHVMCILKTWANGWCTSYRMSFERLIASYGIAGRKHVQFQLVFAGLVAEGRHERLCPPPARPPAGVVVCWC